LIDIDIDIDNGTQDTLTQKPVDLVSTLFRRRCCL